MRTKIKQFTTMINFNFLITFTYFLLRNHHIHWHIPFVGGEGFDFLEFIGQADEFGGMEFGMGEAVG